MRNVSIMASIPMINIGIPYSSLMDISAVSTDGLRECGYQIADKNRVRKSCLKYGWYFIG
jgi:hypothetical protein